MDLNRDMREFVQVCELFPVGRNGLRVRTQDRDDGSVVARSELPHMQIDYLVMLAIAFVGTWAAMRLGEWLAPRRQLER